MSSKKSVLLIGNYPPPYGGVPTHIKSLSEYLAKNGWNVHVLAFSGSAPIRCKVEQHDGYRVYRPSRLQRFVSLLGVGFMPQRMRRFKDEMERVNGKVFWGMLSRMQIAREIVRKENIQVVSAYHVMSGIIASWLKEEFRIPFVLSVFGEVYAQKNDYIEMAGMVEYICSMSDRIVSCSDHCARSLKTIGVKQEVGTVYYGIDVGRFSQAIGDMRIRTRLGVSDEKKVFLYLARMVEEMGLAVFVAAARKVLEETKNTCFWIAGARGTLTLLAENLAAEYPGRVFVMADVPFGDLPYLYSNATVVVVPSVNERACLGLAAVEGMACGKPVIITAMGGGPEVVEAGVHGWHVKPGCSDSLAKAMLSMPEQQVLEAFGAAGKRRAVEVFDQRKTNRDYESMFAACGSSFGQET